MFQITKEIKTDILKSSNCNSAARLQICSWNLVCEQTSAYIYFWRHISLPANWTWRRKRKFCMPIHTAMAEVRRALKMPSSKKWQTAIILKIFNSSAKSWDIFAKSGVWTVSEVTFGNEFKIQNADCLPFWTWYANGSRILDNLGGGLRSDCLLVIMIITITIIFF